MTLIDKKYINVRPLAFVAVSYVLGLVGALSDNAVLACIGSLALIILSVCLSKSKPILFIAMVLAYLLGFIVMASGVLEAEHEIDTDGVLTGRICEEVTVEEYGIRLVLDNCTLECDGGKTVLDKRVLLTLRSDAEYKYGMTVEAETSVSTVETPKNENEYNRKLAHLREGIGYTAYADSACVLNIENDIYGYMLNLRGAVRNTILSSCSNGDSGSILVGMVLGDNENTDDGMLGEFQRTGIAHILAVSGLHVGFVVTALNLLMKRFGIGKRKGFVILCAVLAVYCVVTALSSSTVRASIMALVLSGAKLSGRKYDSLTAISFAALIILLINPLEITSVGFVISFSAVLGIVLVEKHIAGLLKRFPEWIASSLSVSFAAQIGILPALCAYFGRIPVLGIFANLLAVPIAMIGVIGGIGASAVAMILPGVGEAAFRVLEIPISFLISANSFISSLPMASLNIPSVGEILIIVYIAAVVTLSGLVFVSNKCKIATACVSAAVMIIVQLSTAFTPEPDVKIVMFSVGNADSIYISVDGEKHYLVDTGRVYDTASVVLPYLNANGVTKLDGVFITHSDIDHAQGLSVLTEAVECERIYVSEYSMPDGDEMLEILSAGRTLDLGGGVYARVISPSVLVPPSDNDASLVFVLEYGDFSMLFTGDAGDYADAAVIESVEHCTVLKASHHGSKTGTSERLLMALEPEAVLISANDTGSLPADEVTARLDRLGFEYYVTEYSGMITVEVDGDGYSVKTFSEE